MRKHYKYEMLYYNNNGDINGLQAKKAANDNLLTQKTPRAARDAVRERKDGRQNGKKVTHERLKTQRRRYFKQLARFCGSNACKLSRGRYNRSVFRIPSVPKWRNR